jgi:diguanylate cyclase (GGDEF)-like protein
MADPGVRDASGTTFGLILDYVEREGGSAALDAVLSRSGVDASEAELRDEDRWFPFEYKIALLRAASEVLHDRRAPWKVGEMACEARTGGALKLALRALGSPRTVYANVPRASGKFSRTHRMEIVELGDGEARFAWRDLVGRRYEPEDCLYSAGLLACIPKLFGLPPAEVEHVECARDGAETCVYDVRWVEHPFARRFAGALAGVATLVVAVALLIPGGLPIAGALAAAAALAVGTRAVAGTRQRLRLLEARVVQQAEAHERLTASLQDIVSDLRVDEVLAKIVANARAGTVGKEFALLVDDGEGMRCRGSTGVPGETVAALERWAVAAPRVTVQPLVLDDLRLVPELAELPRHADQPLGSLSATPLALAGNARGALVALANGYDIFLPHDIEWLRAYAAQASIALRNARVYEAQEALATRDPLTGLLNHREFHERLAAELERVRRHGGELSVVLLDLNGFKLVNDCAGHAEGDRVLRSVADSLRECCRASDSAFRLGGDEFALLLPETGPLAAAQVAERAEAAAADVDGRTSLSHGVASWPHAGPTKDALLDSADARLYAAKRALRGPAAGGEGGTLEQAGLDARKRLEAGSRLAARLAPLSDPVDVAATAVRELQETFGYFLVVVHRLEGDDLRAVAAAGPMVDESPGLIAGWSQPANEGVNGRVVRTGEPALVVDTARDPDFIPHDPARPAKSELCVPIRAGGALWGVLNVEEREPSAFDLSDLLFTDMVAGQVGAAIRHADVLAQLQQIPPGALARA